MLAIETSRETYYVDKDNNIGCKELIPSGSWKLTGAIEYTNFGHVKRTYSVDEIRAGKVVWRHKNGKQKVFITDLDHGTNRVWASGSSVSRVFETDSQYCYSCRTIQHDKEYCWTCRKPIDTTSKVGYLVVNPWNK